jgi:hypothetical protein
MTDVTSPENVARVLARWSLGTQSEFRDVSFSLQIVCAHCNRRVHPPYGRGCYAGRFSVIDDTWAPSATRATREVEEAWQRAVLS